jgi:hypothetical protein
VRENRVTADDLPSVLFIPDQFMDYRMWSDIPDRLRGRARAIHFDQHAQIPWAADNREFLDAAGRLAAVGNFHVVAAAGHAARFAFALAEAGMAKGLVFFGPSLDCIPDDVDADVFGAVDWDQTLDPYVPIVSALDEPDPGRRRDVLLRVVHDTADANAEPAQLALAAEMMSDHSEELFTHLRASATAGTDGQLPPVPPWLQRPWFDRLAELTVPVTAVGAGLSASAIARRARDAEIIDAAGGGVLPAPAAGRASAAEAILRMLDRLGLAPPAD